MPRRWKEALRVSAPKNIDEVFTSAGPDGISAAEHMGAAISMVQVLANAIRTTSYNVPETLGTEVASAALNAGSGPWPNSAHDGLSELTTLMEQIGEQLSQLSPSDWNRSADSGTQTFTILALAQGVTRVTAERLALVDGVIDTLAG